LASQVMDDKGRVFRVGGRLLLLEHASVAQVFP
jgi:hypothetical protein